MKEIDVTCRRCGRKALSTEIVLDPVYKQMVCPDCVKERKGKEMVQKEMKEQKIKKQPGWDREEDYVERENDNKIAVQRIDSSKVKYTCPKCRYKFIYDQDRKFPSVCPYCSAEISSFQFV